MEWQVALKAQWTVESRGESWTGTGYMHTFWNLWFLWIICNIPTEWSL